MPYKDPEAKRRYMAYYYQQKIKTGEIRLHGPRGLTVLLVRSQIRPKLSESPGQRPNRML